MGDFRRRQLLVAAGIAALTAGCAVNDSRPVSELLGPNESLIVVSLSRTFAFRNVLGEEPFVPIEELGKSEALGLIYSMQPPLRQSDDIAFRSTHRIRLEGSNYLGMLNVIRVPPGRYSLRDWVVPRVYPWAGLGGAVGGVAAALVLPTRGLRGRLAMEFEVPFPGAVLYLGNILLDEKGVVIKADCRDRDLELLRSNLPGVQRERVVVRLLGDAACPR